MNIFGHLSLLAWYLVLLGAWALLSVPASWLHDRFRMRRLRPAGRWYGTGRKIGVTAEPGNVFTVLQWENENGPVYVKVAAVTGDEDEDAPEPRWLPLRDLRPATPSLEETAQEGTG
jgi:hypothetical protein